MTVSISFSELSGYIDRHFGRRLDFSMISDREFGVSYGQKILSRTVRINVSITVCEVMADTIVIKYDGGFGIDMIIAGLLVFLKHKVPEVAEFIISEENRRVRVKLSELSQTKAVFEKMRMTDIVIQDDGLSLIVDIK